jgi:hypothetical protein
VVVGKGALRDDVPLRGDEREIFVEIGRDER